MYVFDDNDAPLSIGELVSSPGRSYRQLLDSDDDSSSSDDDGLRCRPGSTPSSSGSTTAAPACGAWTGEAARAGDPLAAAAGI